MIVRAFQKSDYKQIEEIHHQFYESEFSLNDFCQKFIDFFVIEEDNIIISAGGVRAIAESVIITNKSISARKKREALYKMLETQLFICNSNNFNQLHAFIQNDNWERHLVQNGFKHCKGNALFLQVS